MNKETALKILEINDNKNLSYEEKISQMEELFKEDIEAHYSLKTGKAFGKRNCFILEAFSSLYNFKSKFWISSEENPEIKQNEKPTEYEIITQASKTIKYSLYNYDQLSDDYREKIKESNNKTEKENPIEENLIISDTPENYDNYNLKDYLLSIFNKEVYNIRNNQIFKFRYGFEDNQIHTLEDAGNRYNISRERVRQITTKIIKRIKFRCKTAKRRNLFNIFLSLYYYLETLKKDLMHNSQNNYINQEYADKILTREFGVNDSIYLHLINNLCDTCFVIQKEEKSFSVFIKNCNIKKAILACIEEFSGQYGISGIAKILKGSKLKDNYRNNNSKNSKYYGVFKQMTLSSITSEINELLKDEMLVSSKVSFGLPVLKINPEYKEKIDCFPEEKPVVNDNDDENIKRVLYLIKQNKNLFITGHAGTGKSYILSKLKEKIPSLVITSTTGIAAVNVKGQTLHSWAGVGICNLPINTIVSKILRKAQVKNKIQKCKILAVDEISMLNIKTFEYVDAVLRQVRNCDEPFGGIQVIFIGDFFQLPPVEKNEIVLQKYCFESPLWEALDLKTVLLTKNYRQNEENLITALSNMRTNSLTQEDIALLRTRESRENDDTALHIFATNLEADNYNNLKFRAIKSKEYKLIAIDGVYKGTKLIETPTTEWEETLLKRIDVVCSAEKSISLKIGARVILLINFDFKKGLINGSCGEVKEINDNYILIRFDNGQTEQIPKHDFEFYNNDKLIALRRQFPLKLAYGITIHKSQGMSLDKLVVDCSRIFEKGQAYVALSRIRTLNGLYLKNFSPAKVMVDNTVVEFYKNLKIFDEEI
ncbi:AAA family ATPase [bacterium]|nr:AAA family ATPase [bacterium]